MSRMFAVVELKYDIGKLLLARKDWILTQKKVYSKTEDVFCYWSSNLSDNIANLNCDYSEKFTGEPGLFKVFVVKLTDSLEEAQKSLKGRIKTVAKRFREPGNTDAEIQNMEAKKKRCEKKELKEQQAKAHTMNIEYLVNEMKLHVSSSKPTSVSEGMIGDDMIAPEKSKEKTLIDEAHDGEKYVNGDGDKKKKKKKKECEAEQADTKHIEYSINEEQTAKQSAGNKITETPPSTGSTDIPPSTESTESTGQPSSATSTDQISSAESIEYPSSTSSEHPQSILTQHLPSTEYEHPPSTENILTDFSFDLLPLDESNSCEWLTNELMRNGVDFQIDPNFYEEVKDKELDTMKKNETAQLTAPEVSQPVENIHTIVCNSSNIVTLNFDDLKKQCSEMSLEVDDLKKQNEELNVTVNQLKTEKENMHLEITNINKRNIALQNYLVAMDERVPETLFVEKDKGRLYKGNVFLTEKQCSVLDKAKTDNEFVNNLLVCIFGREILKTHSLTGKASNRTKGKPKPALDKELVQLIYDIVDARSISKKKLKLTKRQKNDLISKKIANVSNHKDPGERQAN